MVTQPDQVVPKTLVERLTSGKLQPLDFVLDHQFAALQLDYLQVVCGWMGESLVQFAFQNPMFAFQFNEMRLYCHTKSPRLWTSDSIWTIKSTPVRAAVDGY